MGLNIQLKIRMVTWYCSFGIKGYYPIDPQTKQKILKTIWPKGHTIFVCVKLAQHSMYNISIDHCPHNI